LGKNSKMARHASDTQTLPIRLESLQAENAELRSKLQEAQETILAIQTGAVDAFVVQGPEGHRVYTLEGAERPYRLLVEQMQQGAATLLADGTIAFCNQRFAELLKVPHKKLIGLRLRDFIDSEDQAVYDNLLWQGQRRSGRGEAHLRPAGGGQLPVFLTFGKLPRECGEGIGVLITDLTTQKHHEQLTAAHAELWRIQEKEAARRAEFEALMNAAPTAIWVSHDPDCRRISGNAAAAKMMRMSPDQNMSKSAPPDEVPRHVELFRDGVLLAPEELPMQKAVHTGLSVPDQELEFRFSDGSVQWAYGNAVPLFDASGHIRGAISAFLDITPRRRAEEASRESESRLLAFLEQLPVGVAAIDINGRMVVSNAIMRRFVPEVIPSRDPQRIGRWRAFHSDGTSLDSHDWPTPRALRGETSGCAAEMLYTTDDGKQIWTRVTSEPLRNQSGEITGAICVLQEIDAIKQAELALKEADRRKDGFLATLAHELRNPLAPIASSLALLNRAGNDLATIDQARATMQRQVAHMSRLVDDLLDLSRITRDRLELRKQRFELGSVLGDALEACQPMVESARHELYCATPAEPIYLYADPVRITQVVGNLLANACKYTPPGGRIELSASRAGSDVVVTVKDNGIGIRADMLGEVFQMFTQVQAAIDRTRGGLGVGLHLVKRLVELHGGQVSAHSQGLGRGSQFVVRLPIVSPKADELEVPKSGTGTPSGKRRILVVDDNADSAVSLAMLLRCHGHEAHTAADGLEAVESAQALRPEIVLLDIGLPKLNGYEACRRIRETSWGEEMVLVAITGWGQEADRVKSKEAGFDYHLVKPVDFERLREVLASGRPVLT
jgi:signal transduction histidine kinase